MLSGVLLAVGSAAPAGALESLVSDGQDDPAAVDITSAHYVNRERSVATTVAVRDLGDTGRLVARYGVPDSDSIYEARVRAKADGTLVTGLTYVTNISREPVSCSFSASWSPEEDFVAVQVPQRCLKFGTFLEETWFQATLHRGSDSDAVQGLDVGRGDSPGCASNTEMKKVAEGDKKFDVHQRLDTAGLYDGAGAGSYGRTYTACDGGDRWFVQYSAEDDTVVNTGRVD